MSLAFVFAMPLPPLARGMAACMVMREPPARNIRPPANPTVICAVACMGYVESKAPEQKAKMGPSHCGRRTK